MGRIEQIAYSNKLRDKIIEIVEDKCFAEDKRETPTPLAVVYPLLHFLEGELHEYGKHLQGKVLNLTQELEDAKYEIETLRGQIVDRDIDLKDLQERVNDLNMNADAYNDLLGRYTTAIADGHDLLKSNEAKDNTIERLEGELSEAVEIMGAIYDNVDKYHLDFAFTGGECYDKLKDYLGV